MDGHHLGVHGERGVGAVAAADALKRDEGLGLWVGLMLRRRGMLLLLLRLILLFL